MEKLLQMIKPKDVGRTFGYIIFSSMFVYDIVWGHQSLGWDNGGIFAVVVLGDTLILQLARIKYGMVEDPSSPVQDVPYHCGDHPVCLSDGGGEKSMGPIEPGGKSGE